MRTLAFGFIFLAAATSVSAKPLVLECNFSNDATPQSLLFVLDELSSSVAISQGASAAPVSGTIERGSRRRVVLGWADQTEDRSARIDLVSLTASLHSDTSRTNKGQCQIV